MFQTLTLARRHHLRLGALWLTTAGCSLVTALTDLNSEVGATGADASTGRDASVDAALEADADSAAAEDAPDDHASADVVQRDAGALDALCGADAYALCDDFDTRSLGDPAMWTSKTLGLRGASLAFATNVPFSSPRALQASVPADAGSNPVACLSRDFLGAAKSIDCSMQLRIENVGTGLLQALTLAVTPPPATAFEVSTVELRVVTGAMDLRVTTPLADGGMAYSVQRDLGPPLLGQWLRTRFRLSALDGATHVEVWLGGNLALDEAITLAPVGRLTLDIGAVGSVVGDVDMRALFDDVACEVVRP